MSEKLKVGYTSCYVYDRNADFITTIPGKAAMEWVKEVCPDCSLDAHETPIKDIDSNLWKDYWYNKLYIVIGIRGINYLALYRHDDEIKLVEITDSE